MTIRLRKGNSRTGILPVSRAWYRDSQDRQDAGPTDAFETEI